MSNLQIKTLKELHSKHPYNHHLDFTFVNILFYLLYHTSLHFSIPQCFLFFDAFQGKLQAWLQYHVHIIHYNSTFVIFEVTFT